MTEKLYKNNIEELNKDSLKNYLLILNKVDELMDKLEESGLLNRLMLLNEAVVYKENVDLSSIGVTSIYLMLSEEENIKSMFRHGSSFKKFKLLYGHHIYYCIYKIEVNGSFLSSLNLSEKDCGFFIEYRDLKVCSNELNLVNANLTGYSELNSLNINPFIDSLYCHFGQLKLLNHVKCNYLSIECKGSSSINMNIYKQIILNMMKNVNEYIIIKLTLDEDYLNVCKSLDNSLIIYEKYYFNDEYDGYLLFINCKEELLCYK